MILGGLVLLYFGFGGSFFCVGTVGASWYGGELIVVEICTSEIAYWSLIPPAPSEIAHWCLVASTPSEVALHILVLLHAQRYMIFLRVL